MFSLLIDLAGASIIGYPTSTGAWIVSVPGQLTHPLLPLPYEAVMRSNAADGPRFIKPQRGHEDGCVAGVCSERRANEYLS